MPGSMESSCRAELGRGGLAGVEGRGGRNKDKLRCGLWCLNDGHWRQNEGTKWSERKAWREGGDN